MANSIDAQRSTDFQEKEIVIKNFHDRIDESNVPLKVAIIGASGTGKSSFINSVMTCASRKCWRDQVGIGNFGGGGEQFTHHLQRFTKEDYLDDKRNLLHNYPILIDMTGFENNNTAINKELLRMVMFGIIPNEHKLHDAWKEYNDNGMKGLKQKYRVGDDLLRVDRIIFVASAKTALPLLLMEAVKETALKEERIIPIYGVMTNEDSSSVVNDQEGFKDKEYEFRTRLGLGQNRYLLCTNYCDDYDRHVGKSRTETTHPELDIRFLKFMMQVCDPKTKVIRDNADIRRDEDGVPDVSDVSGVQNEPTVTTTQTDDDHLGINNVIVFAIKGLLIAVLLIWFLSPPPEVKNLITACSQYEQLSTNAEFANSFPEMKTVCQNQSKFSNRQLIQPLMYFVVVIIGTDFIIPQILKSIFNFA